MTDTDPILTTKQAHARYPFIAEATFRFWRHAGIGPASFKVGARVLYRQSELDRWIASQEEATVRGGDAA